MIGGNLRLYAGNSRVGGGTGAGRATLSNHPVKVSTAARRRGEFLAARRRFAVAHGMQGGRPWPGLQNFILLIPAFSVWRTSALFLPTGRLSCAPKRWKRQDSADSPIIRPWRRSLRAGPPSYIPFGDPAEKWKISSCFFLARARLLILDEAHQGGSFRTEAGGAVSVFQA